MITPENAGYILDSLKAHKELQESILRDIARRLVNNPDALTDTAAWQAEKLQQSGLLFDDITKELSAVTKRQKAEIEEAFKTAETQIFDYDDAVISKAGFDPVEFKKMSPSMQKMWTATLAKTSTEAINLTKTTALTSQSAYIEACDLAMMQVQSGAFSLDAAVKNACLSAGSKGVNVVYPSGWVDKLDVAVRRSTFTGVSQTAGKLQEMRADELDQDIMELSAHSGARPDHAVWQGKLVSRSGKPGYLNLGDIGYGTVTGFKGANCSHEWFMFFEGISKRKYTDEQLEAFKNETVTYNDKEMPLWKAKDYQRSLERSIKEKKRQLVTLDEAIKNAKSDGLKAELTTEFNNIAVKLKGQEAKLKDFCKQTGIYYDKSRLQVFTQATENGIKNWGKSVSEKAVWANKKSIDNSAKSGIIKEKVINTIGKANYQVDESVISSEEYGKKFAGIFASEKANNVLCRESRRAIRRNANTPNETFVFVDKTGKKLDKGHTGAHGGTIDVSCLSGLADNCVALTHNHPLSVSFSEDDLKLLNDFPQLRCIVAAGHNGTVYKLSIGNGTRVLENIQGEYLRLLSEIGNTDRCVEILAKKYGWRYEKI